MSRLPPDSIRQLTRGERFLAADRVDLAVPEIATWDPYLLREHHMLVPVNLLALYVQPGSTERMVRLPLFVAGPNGVVVTKAEDGMPDPFADGEPRPAGVHLHWAMPDALLRGTLDSRPGGTPNRLSLPRLPDRWVVLRVLLPAGASNPLVTGWVLEADRAVAVPLALWTEGGAASQAATPQGVTVPKAELTGTVGGSVSWSGIYDAVLNRFAFHDPLADVAALAPNGVDENCAAYLVAGWWSNAASDPLDKARNSNSLHELLEQLQWGLLAEWGEEQPAHQEEQAQLARRKSLGLETADRWSNARPFTTAAAREPAAPAAPFVPLDGSFVETPGLTATSAFATVAGKHFVARPWQLRSTLLHGAIYGVPVAGNPPADRRPAASALSVAFGHHDNDLLAAFAAPPQATAEQRRSTERLLAAFTSQKINSLGSPNGIVDLEEHEHATGFSSLPSGSAGTDRYLQRVQTGGAGGLNVGKHRVKTKESAARKSAASADASALFFATTQKPTLIAASETIINDLARSRVGDVLMPTEARVVDRPAARFTFSDEPMVAIRGASRSLRHGGDGRASADGKLTCRWPTHVITEISGVIAKDRFIRTLGNGSIPSEVLSLARELLILDPYHDEWLAAAVAPRPDVRPVIFDRLKAESLLRFGVDGAYDGATVAFQSASARSRAGQAIEPGVRETQMLVADGMRRFSLYKGVDPDPVGVTTWAQPWVPMWMEWEVSVEGLDPRTLDAWRLGSIDLERDGTAIEGSATLLRGRAVLTTGAASTLHDAIADWLKAEDALDAVDAGLVDEATEDALRRIDAAVRHLDVVTAALDGVRAQLLGLPVRDGLMLPRTGTTSGKPAPVRGPVSLAAGAITLKRVRLVDVFGRTLDVPLDTVATPARASLPDRPGALSLEPRLLRPARWQFRLVDASTAVGTEGVEARVDQIDPALQVNPVAGFVMPDHLDESLEIFGVDGAPLGELLHEPVSGGVIWEIAAGREGPADSAPRYGPTDAQRALGDFATGLIASDARARAGRPLAFGAPRESALSALLRAIDTTLWSVDTFASLGSEHVAGLVGRPIAVVRAQLRLELKPPDDIDLSNPIRAAEWADAERFAARYAFPVRIGEVTRSDDGVLGFFVDDDYSHFRLVDKAIAGAAADAGRSRGQLGLHGARTAEPSLRRIEHGYIAGTSDADTLMLHLGQTVTLTLFMHPTGKASLTSGVLPRKALALARDWVGPGLGAIAPSLRTGPVLVETDLDPERQVRLPKVSVFGKDQNFLWRDTPATWRTDAILAATQTALLPDTPAEFREGWIRVAPANGNGEGG